MDQSNRITKDISARKTPNKMHSAMEMQAVRASHEAYLNSMIRGYEGEAATSAAEHEQEIKDLKAAMTRDKAQITHEKEAAVTEAVRGALAGSSTQVNQLQAEVQRLQGELKESRERYENLRDSANERIQGKLNKIEKMRTQHDVEVADLKEQLKVGPNTWYEIHFKSKGRRDRKYLRKPYAVFSEAVQDLCRDIGIGRASLSFEVQGKSIYYFDHGKTIEALGIEHGSTVNYTKN